MKVCIVSDALIGYQNKGGAEVQMEKTIEVLKKNNIEVVFYDNNPETILSSDAVHFFKSLFWYWPIASFCLKHNKPYFVSSIFYITDKYNLIQFSFAKYLGGIGMLSVSNIIRLWNNAACVFPNTTSEEEQISKYALKSISIIVRNCVDDDYVNAKIVPELLPKKIQELKGKFILNIGRIEERKNQLKLSIACEKLKIPLVLIGPNNMDSYYDQVLSFKNNIYLGEVWDQSLKKTIINECSVFALPSVLETPGIVAIEAKYLHKKIVITKNGIGKGYFDDYKFITKINPSKTNEIYKALKKMISIHAENLIVEKLDIPLYNSEIDKVIKGYLKTLK